jgi:YedE family putative selenium metabolism protein
MLVKISKQTLVPLLLTGGIIGIAAIILMKLGNPPNMGVCVACFIRDTAGALGLDSAATVQYIRPEIIGFILGSFLLSLIGREFKPSGGTSPLARFAIAFFVMTGALVFLGCPLRMVLRLAAGDLNALIGLAGFVSGIALGSFFLRKGFSLGQPQPQPKANGFIMPLLALALLVFLLVRPAFIKFSEQGPGSMHAPVAVSLIAALVIGAVVQKSGLCMSGGFRDLILIKNPTMAFGYCAIFAAALVMNLIVGNFKLGFIDQPIAHQDFVWNFLGMALAGYGSVLLGGCPLRQVIMSGEGNADAGICVLGFLVAGATAHNFGIAASPAGVPLNGQIAVILGFAVITGIVFLSMRKNAAPAA